ncbi:MAG: sensor histidine kinase [Hyphomonadaceae bacterium]|nr:sensor histidine kinase [Hyphomonadaceae bacterium]
MFDEADLATRPDVRSGKRYVPPELAIDLEGDNALLRAALAKSEGAGERRELITQELKHRIGNLLAVVQAVARQTFSTADAASVEAFNARLLALAEAQKLLIDSETRPASLAEVVTAALAPHCSDGDRATITGPELALNGRRAHGLTLALHELATNAAKYGALSTDRGWIEIVWTIDAGQLAFLWREHAGPSVVTPARRGFGSLLITRNLGVAFGGKVDVQFHPTGLECRLLATTE